MLTMRPPLEQSAQIGVAELGRFAPRGSTARSRALCSVSSTSAATPPALGPPARARGAAPTVVRRRHRVGLQRRDAFAPSRARPARKRKKRNSSTFDIRSPRMSSNVASCHFSALITRVSIEREACVERLSAGRRGNVLAVPAKELTEIPASPRRSAGRSSRRPGTRVRSKTRRCAVAHALISATVQVSLFPSLLLSGSPGSLDSCRSERPTAALA